MPNLPLKRDARNEGFDRSSVDPTSVSSATVRGAGRPLALRWASQPKEGFPLQYLFLTIFFFFSLVPNFAFCGQVIQYEPVVVELSGTVHQGKFQHPNGQWVHYSFIKLKVPVEIRADQENEINCDETDISEIQLYSNSERIGRTLKAKAGRCVIVTGTVFHEHTAWHIRPLVMIVSQVL